MILKLIVSSVLVFLSVPRFRDSLTAVRLHYKGTKNMNESAKLTKNWGGARKGAGRKSIDASKKRVSVTFALTAETKERIHQAAKAAGLSASEFVTRWAEQL